METSPQPAASQPGVTVLQLDTRFPRIAGDVASPESYITPLELLRIDAATVAKVVSPFQEQMDIALFADAVRCARGRIITTSCGFLAPWQQHLASLTRTPLITSAVIDLPKLIARYGSRRVAILTFDARALQSPHYGALLKGFDGPVIGLPASSHLYNVIAGDMEWLDPELAAGQLIDLLDERLPAGIDALLFECTNLPPYRHAIETRFGLDVFDILWSIDQRMAGVVAPSFLPAARLS